MSIPSQAIPNSPASLGDFLLPRRRTNSRILRRYLLVCCLVIVILSLVNLLGWVLTPGEFDPDQDKKKHVLTRLISNSNSMVPATTYTFLLFCMALVVKVYRLPFWGRRKIVFSMALVIIFWSLGVLWTWILEVGNSPLRKNPSWGWFWDNLRESGMSPGTALGFLMASIALFGIALRPNRHLKYLATFFIALGFIFSYILLGEFVTGYFYHEQYFSRLLLPEEKKPIAVAFPTALNMFILFLGLMAAPGPGRLIFRRIMAHNIQGLLLRSFLPISVGSVILSHPLFFWINQVISDPQFHDFIPEIGGIKLTTEILTAKSFIFAGLVGLAVLFLVYRAAGKVGLSLEKSQGELNKARDLAEMAAKSRDLFLAQVSHELRTPLNHILGFCQLLEFTPLDESQQQDLQKITRAGHHLLSLINDILDYQKIIMGQIPIDLEEIEAAAALKEIADSMESKVRERGNQFVIDCPSNLGAVKADPKRFRQILVNLLSNSAKFTKNGVITVSARRQKSNGQDWIVLKVIDTGKGISSENLKELFKPFKRLEDKKDNPEGTGLGLAISKTLCEKMGGNIRVFSGGVGKGATFTVRLPSSLTHGEAIPLPTHLKESVPGSDYSHNNVPGQKRRSTKVYGISGCPVLVVDDDPNVGELMKRFLGEKGFAIHVANHGAQALEMVKTVRPAVITLDLMMPGIDGWSVLAALKNDPETADIPVIIVSILENRTKGFRLGAAEYINKPVDWDRLANIMEKYKTARKNTILLVDDDASFREICRRSLQKNAWSVMEAENGRAGLQRLAEHVPNLVLLDLMMPVMNGFEFLDEIRSNPAWSGIPIIVITSKDVSPEDRSRLNGGVMDILEKGKRNLDDLLRDILQDVQRYVANVIPGQELTHAQNSAR